MQNTTAAATYAKLKDGSWGVRSTSPVKPGAVITVTKKSGDSKMETISRVLWSGDGVFLCAIAASKSASSSSYRAGTCTHCGDTCNPHYRTCYECSNGGMSFTDSRGNFVLGSDD